MLRLTSRPKETFTRLNDRSDPSRNLFFQYTWGSWLKNDALEKARRETRFNIENLSTFVKSLKVQDSEVLAKPQALSNGIVTLPNNMTQDIMGGTGFELKSIASIHEGKHHRVYKLTLASDKELVLRIPYKLESDFAIEQKIKSEVATMDFLAEKLNASVPKVLAYGATRTNPLQTPFILIEHIEGELLMKQWDPMMADSDTSKAKLLEVIQPIMNFSDTALSVTFNRFGSLYFFDDVNPEQQSVLPYDGETNEALKNRWRIGPSVERVFSKNKKHLNAQQVGQFNGPWDANKPLDMITDVAGIHLESLRLRLALAQADAGNKVENVDALKKQIGVFDDLKTMSQKLFNPTSKSVMNVTEMFKPRLFFPDLDPLNVIVRDGVPVFLDFEHASIKPFILANYPSFIAYQGAKIYNLEDEIPEYSTMDDVDKQQYQFMYYKTRNERMWEHALNEKRHDLIAVASPHVKVLKAPYLQALECKSDKDYLFVENAMVQLQAMWNVYVANGLVNTEENGFPIEYTQTQLDEHQAYLEDHQTEVMSTPFAATGGWVPQDMFAVLKEQNILVKDKNGDYFIEKEAVLRDVPGTENTEGTEPKTEQ
ncbi:altered inheritance of mitochondria protein 9, mitochondrial [Metschnikowia bicuspidata var. bicuspidata NRRL YB-4993]|uniref:Altered inheritance of mitochondria protein 9, mitochondrial n=1 Tax=Metschnikowia bicuspidata var. bicuspidata NRRL YB-4993 TaxID=869754 RepID=A0A1A0H247_9ASCO|nr:altered inheritance of mitochondria protein 9, mitochondrial [Metschnikowia bicuspidata var. bicuspidata NRRL YB-4993]OBA17997.1 altered inheritance of mitochondria protein 9, mitochondrial [Metschnikowia bicuspidata var. bicuspidata NRRL YB-4993]